MTPLTPIVWRDYELVDTGDGEKLERFGEHVLRRPEAQASWTRFLPEEEWMRLVHATFRLDSVRPGTAERGKWIRRSGMPAEWSIGYAWNGLQIRMRLELAETKQVGIFPEQAENWNYIFRSVRAIGLDNPRVLNLFAYTGGASLAARAAGADVFHVDSVRRTVHRAAENQAASDLDGIHWVVEDAITFMQREHKRGRTYRGIVLDPPAYGHGPGGERWVLEEGLGELLDLADRLLEPEHAFFILNVYSLGLTASDVERRVRGAVPATGRLESGSLRIADRAGKKLSLGVLVRFRR
jgi:23S rRNA (cytosine1962-C5)-methyltransferase